MKVLTNRMNWSVMASVVSGCSLVVMFRYLPSLSISARSDFDVTGTGLEWSNFCVRERIALLQMSLGLL